MKFGKLPQNVFTGFLEALHIKFTYAFSDKYFREHPHKYNLLGLSQMLSDYGILNAGTKITDKENDIFDIELPFIAHTGSDFVVVHNVETGKVSNPAIEVEFEKHEAWKAKTQLRATPTILVNGYKLPENYKIEDLHHFTELEFGSTVIAEVKVGSNPENKGFNINI